MKLFSGLKKIREFERLQLPFFKSLIDFDIVIEIGYLEEQGQAPTLKQLFLLNISSRTTVRRKLAKLIAQGIVIRRIHANDYRAGLLTISPSAIKLLANYGDTLTAVSTLHFAGAHLATEDLADATARIEAGALIESVGNALPVSAVGD